MGSRQTWEIKWIDTRQDKMFDGLIQGFFRTKLRWQNAYYQFYGGTSMTKFIWCYSWNMKIP